MIHLLSSTSEDPNPLCLSLAPMEGVTDWIMRDILTSLGGIDFCVTEFLRVTKNLHPNKVFYRHCPELLTESKTSVGTPVILQLLGGDPLPMGENAQRAAELGAAGIDLNFGCPAKTVNRHDGGAVLLKASHRLYDITKSVRQSVPATIPVSGKIRLGFEDASLFVENALALQEAGASWITVHCRTKSQGYRPPAHWHFISHLKHKIHIPVIANGDIDSVHSFNACKEITQGHAFMIGRAGLSNPFLFKKIKNLNVVAFSEEEEWNQIEELITHFYSRCAHHINGYFATARTKQWLKFLLTKKPPSIELFNKIKIYKDPSEFHYHLLKNLKSNNNDTPLLSGMEVNKDKTPHEAIC